MGILNTGKQQENGIVLDIQTRQQLVELKILPSSSFGEHTLMIKALGHLVQLFSGDELKGTTLFPG